MSKYDDLDPTEELEQEIASDLESAFNKRGLTVDHLGDESQHAPAGKPDIRMENDSVLFIIEVTSSTGAAQDREFNSIRDHLKEEKQDNSNKDCFCIFVSPETGRRMLSSIQEHNYHRKNKDDLKILPLSFDSFELIIKKLSGSVADLYSIDQFTNIFTNHEKFIDDQRTKKELVENIFYDDEELREEIEQEETERDQKLLEDLIDDLEKLENYLREQGIATGERAIDTLIYLVFIKLYEEQRFRDGKGPNRLKQDHFSTFKQNQQRQIREDDLAIQELFKIIKAEEEFTESGMFSDRDQLPEDLTDDFVTEELIPIFNKYDFLGTKIDALGAVYEVLAQRANKDVKVGQFFTPENIVDFMVNIADLNPDDTVVDPACGTGRFLIDSMNNMCDTIEKGNRRNKSNKKDEVKSSQLYGADIDNRIAKIAKMNMWVHGDGKSNILKSNGLKLHNKNINGSNIEKDTDTILTNPPLGKFNYQDGYDDEFRQQMKPVLPVTNTTQDRLDTINNRLNRHKSELEEMEDRQAVLKQTDVVSEYENLSEKDNPDEDRLSELEEDELVDEYKKLPGKISRKESTIERNEEEQKELEVQIRKGDSEFEITGKKIKGGALFIKSSSDYLKSDRNPDMPPEWRGGKLITILDEGLLNTEDYRRVRKYLRDNFYIKAVISLTPDTFVPVSKTNTKTSIVYAIKKENETETQKEPIFYGHVKEVGLDTKGNACDNHLPEIRQKFENFQSTVLDSYKRKRFDETQFDESDIAQAAPDIKRNKMFYETQSEETDFYTTSPPEPGDRLDYFFQSPKTRVLDELEDDIEFTRLGDICEEPIVRGKQPDYDEEGEVMVIKTAEIKNSHIEYDETRRVSEEFYESNSRAQIKKGDILVTSTGLGSLGRVDIYDRDKKAVVDSHISIVRVKQDYDPYFIAFFLRSYIGQVQFEKWFNGSSGQIEIQPEDLSKFLVPSSEEFDKNEQKSVAKSIQEEYEEALQMRRKAENKLSSLRFELECQVDIGLSDLS